MAVLEPDDNTEDEQVDDGAYVTIEYPVGAKMTLAQEFEFKAHQTIIDGLLQQYIENLDGKEPDPNVTQMRQVAQMFIRGFHTQQAAYRAIIGNLLTDNFDMTFDRDVERKEP